MNRKKTILSFLIAITFCPTSLLSSDYDLSVDVRYRLENDKSHLVPPGKQSSINTLRSRIGLRFIGATASAHFTLQDSRLLGDVRNGLYETQDVFSYTFLHQAYFHFRYRKQLIQLGRFELPRRRQSARARLTIPTFRPLGAQVHRLDELAKTNFDLPTRSTEEKPLQRVPRHSKTCLPKQPPSQTSLHIPTRVVLLRESVGTSFPPEGSAPQGEAQTN